MKPKKCVVSNFGSYHDAEISFDNLGLTLISGPTGAGKSTITDFVSWACFGVTSKNGASDDVRAWGCDEPTRVTLDVELPDGEIQIVRTRGKPTQNDLYFTEASNPEKEIRGKDMTETGRLLEKRLGVDAELYLLASAFTQFSDSDKFFTCKAKERRDVLERITDLSLPVTLAEAASEARKVAKKELEALETSLSKEIGRQEQLLSQKRSVEQALEAWERQHALAITAAEHESASFEDNKTAKIEKMAAQIEALAATVKPDEDFTAKAAKIEAEQAKLTGVRVKHKRALATVSDLKAELAASEREYAKQECLPDTCPTCNRPGAAPNREEHLAEAKLKIGTLRDALGAARGIVADLEKTLEGEYALGKALADLQRERAENQRRADRMEADEQALIALDAQENPYLHRLEQLAQTKNPYKGQVAEAVKAAGSLDETLKRLEADRADKEHRVVSLSSIYDLSFALRGELLQSAVSQLERETNGNLSEYFDGVFSIALTLEGSDKLMVTVSKEGHEVAYAQLSGGERRQLVLSFWRALSKRAWECAGVTSSLIVMDEAFSGLDDTLKVKAFRMLEDMSDEFESILVIDHSPAMQMMFSREIRVEKQGENSVIEDVVGTAEAA